MKYDEDWYYTPPQEPESEEDEDDDSYFQNAHGRQLNMTDCQAYAQQQEQEQQETESLWERQRLMSQNHGKMIGCAQAIRDANLDDDYVRIAIKYLLEALKEHDDLQRRFK